MIETRAMLRLWLHGLGLREVAQPSVAHHRLWTY